MKNTSGHSWTKVDTTGQTHSLKLANNDNPIYLHSRNLKNQIIMATINKNKHKKNAPNQSEAFIRL